MILLADLGNRSLTLSLYEKRKEVASFKTVADKFRSSDEYADTLRQFFSLQKILSEDISGCLLESVVPSLTKRVEKAINTILDKPCLILDRTLKTGLAIRMDNPSEVGSNLISAAVGANNDYKKDCLVICLSSCLTFSLVTEDKQFLGGSLFPGLRESVDLMCKNNAQLMEIDLHRPKRAISKSTSECINSGVILGYLYLIGKMADEMEKEYGKPLLRVITGPDGGIIRDYLPHNFIYNPHLLMDGLYDIYMKNKDKNE